MMNISCDVKRAILRLLQRYVVLENISSIPLRWYREKTRVGLYSHDQRRVIQGIVDDETMNY